jgi:hypothetical protein
MATWSKELLLECIEEFRGCPCIWKVKSKEYHNREMNKNAYSALTGKVKTTDQANKETVMKKNNNYVEVSERN